MILRHVIGPSIKRTVEIGAVVLCYQDFQRAQILQKHCFQFILLKTRTHYLALPLFDRKRSLTYFDLFLNFEPIISPVNRDFLLDLVNFVIEPLRVSVHV